MSRLGRGLETRAARGSPGPRQNLDCLPLELSNDGVSKCSDACVLVTVGESETF